MKSKNLLITFLALFVMVLVPCVSRASLPIGCHVMPENVSDNDCDGIADNIDNCPVARNGACECPSVDENGFCVYANPTVELLNALLCSLNGDTKVSEQEFLAGNQANWNKLEVGDMGGDACEDYDDDGVKDYSDNCKLIANADQADINKDSIGDACQDTDNDGIMDYYKYLDSDNNLIILKDNCVDIWNPKQEDRDGDIKGDVCDPCPLDEDDMCTDDKDKDGILDWEDNCEYKYNPDQLDSDADAIGDVCDNCVDLFNPEQIDVDENTIGDACEIAKSADPLPPTSEAQQGGGGCNLGESSSMLSLLMLIPMVFIRRKK